MDVVWQWGEPHPSPPRSSNKSVSFALPIVSARLSNYFHNCAISCYFDWIRLTLAARCSLRAGYAVSVSRRIRRVGGTRTDRNISHQPNSNIETSFTISSVRFVEWFHSAVSSTSHNMHAAQSPFAACHSIPLPFTRAYGKIQTRTQKTVLARVPCVFGLCYVISDQSYSNALR